MTPTNGAAAPSRNLQHGKLPRNYLRGALNAGVPIHALRTVARIAIHTSGNAAAVAIKTGTLARHVGVSRRTIQRDVAAIMGAELPEFDVKRHRPQGEARLSWPTEYQMPRLRRSDPGTIVWAAQTELPAWRAATATQQGILLYLQETIGPTGREISARQIAREVGRSISCVREALRYWRVAGVLEVEQQSDPVTGQRANWVRVRAPWDVVAPDSPMPRDVREARAVSAVTRWGGLHIARLAAEDEEAGWWDALHQAATAIAGAASAAADAARGRILDRLASYLNGPARGLGYHGSGRHRDIYAAIPVISERAEGFRAEYAEMLAERGGADARTGRRPGEPWAGDEIPPQPAHLPAASAPPSAETWAQVTEALTVILGMRPFWSRSMQVPAIDGGHFVVVVENAAFGDWLCQNAGAIRTLCDGLGGPVKVRLASYQSSIDDAAARRRCEGQHRRTLERLQPRLRHIEQEHGRLPALPPLPSITALRTPLGVARQTRSDALISLNGALREAVATERAVAAGLAWTPGAPEREPDWIGLEEDALLLAERVSVAEARLRDLMVLGPIPAELLPAAPQQPTLFRS